MTLLSFVFNFRSVEMRDLQVPVEVRRPDYELVARQLSSEPVPVGPGTYYVTAFLPAGQRLQEEVSVADEPDHEVVLAPRPGDEAADAFEEVFLFLGHGRLEEEGAVPEGVQVTVRLVAGNVLEGRLTYAADVMTVGEPRKFYGGTTTRLLQVGAGDAPSAITALPASPERFCRAVVLPAGDGGLRVGVHLENTQADLLLQYMRQGFLAEARLTSRSPLLAAQRLLEDKKEDPVAGAVGAYALLRFNDLERLGELAPKLALYNEWLADGLPIWAEHLARGGEHKRACRVLLGLRERGLPVFSDGLTYAVDRLRDYTWPGREVAAGDELEQARELLARLQRVALFADFREPVLTLERGALDELVRVEQQDAAEAGV